LFVPSIFLIDLSICDRGRGKTEKIFKGKTGKM